MRKILIVDDDDFMRETLTDILTEMGYEADLAGSGEEALTKITVKNYDIALIDLKMQGLNGCQTFRQIKELSPATKAIIMTAYSHEALIKDCLREGAFGVLYKPLDMAQVSEQLRIVDKKNVIMIIEDDATMRESTAELLSEQGYYTVGVPDSAEAIEYAVHTPPHMVIIDVKLPGLSGCDVFFALKDMIPSLQAIITTGYRHQVQDMVDLCLEHGALTCFYKPYKPKELLEAVKKVFGS